MRRAKLTRFFQTWLPGIFAPKCVPSRISPERTAEDVERIVKRDFPAEEFAPVMAILNEYVARFNDDPSPVRLAVLKLADGNVERLRALIESAKSDYRDIVLAAIVPSYLKIGGILRQGKQDLPERTKRKIFESERQQYEDWLQR
jgi:hypothetical protein